MNYHPIFSKFPRWTGTVLPGYQTNFLGVAIKSSYCNFAPNPGPSVTPDLPIFNEEYFEWIDLLESIVAAKDSFTMLDLGAGFGRWCTNAAAALRHTSIPPDKQFFYMVEAEPQHFQWLLEHAYEHELFRLQSHAYEVAVTNNDGEVGFYTGNPTEWYGQAVGGETMVSSMSLNTILSNIEHQVDFLDCDIQGSELPVFLSAARAVNAKVKRVHIATHSLDAQSGLNAMFENMGWKQIHSFPFATKVATEYGDIYFQDGLESWSNPNL